MNRRDLEELVSIAEWPCISVIAPMEHRAPDNQQNAIRVKTLLKKVREKLGTEGVPPEEAKPVLARLERLVGDTELFSYPGLGLALFASPSFQRRLELPFPVHERVVVDRIFATRDILVALERGVRYRAVVLGGASPRLLDGYRDHLAEGVSTDQLPLVVVGLDAEIVAFLRESPLAASVFVTMHGRHEHTSPRELGRLLWPIVSEAFTARRRERVHRELDVAIKHARLVSGLEDVWLAAHQGRGALLVVEEELHFPIEKGVGQRALLRAPAGLEAENAIDEIVDIVISMGGEVQFAERGSLPEHQGIALVTRYAAVKEVA